MLLRPLGLEISEVVLLIRGGEPWRTMILTILDVVVSCVSVVPYSLRSWPFVFEFFFCTLPHLYCCCCLLRCPVDGIV
ncbi:unnamed protein product [Ectocarpus sp. 6 AP-2014]